MFCTKQKKILFAIIVSQNKERNLFLIKNFENQKAQVLRKEKKVCEQKKVW